MSKFAVYLFIGVAALLSVTASQAQENGPPVQAVDIVGRTVKLDRPAKRIVLGHWVTLDALSLLAPDPVALLAGWTDGGANSYQRALLRDKFPTIDSVPVVGRGSLDQLSVEAILALKPDLVLLSRFDAFRFGDANSSAPPQLAQLEAAGIPVAIVDFFLDPMENSIPSLRIIGDLIGRPREAAAFARFYEAHMAALQEKFHGEGEAAEPPSVFLHAFANRDECCLSAGHGTLDGLITRAGGHNIGTEKLQGAIGQLNLEFVIVRNPDIYLATTVPHDAESGGFALGPGVAEDQARTGFERLLSRADLLAIGAVNNRRAFGMWHQFTHTPLHVVALEALAKFLHPELFGDLDPHATLADINQRFLAAPLDGTLWTTADSAPEE